MDNKFKDYDWGISIHAPRGGSDMIKPTDDAAAIIFQSTLPVGGATPPEAAPERQG